MTGRHMTLRATKISTDHTEGAVIGRYRQCASFKNLDKCVRKTKCHRRMPACVSVRRYSGFLRTSCSKGTAVDDLRCARCVDQQTPPCRTGFTALDSIRVREWRCSRWLLPALVGLLTLDLFSFASGMLLKTVLAVLAVEVFRAILDRLDIGHNDPLASGAKTARAARTGGTLAAARGRRIVLAGLTLGLVTKVIPLLRIFVRLRRGGFQIFFAVGVRLNVGHIDLPH